MHEVFLFVRGIEFSFFSNIEYGIDLVLHELISHREEVLVPLVILYKKIPTHD